MEEKTRHKRIFENPPPAFQPGQIMATPPLKIPNKVEPMKTRRGQGEGKKKKGSSASWEISALIKQACFLSPSAGIMCLAHYSPDYCFSPAITGKSQ